MAKKSLDRKQSERANGGGRIGLAYANPTTPSQQQQQQNLAPTKSFLNLTTSALSGVFGSQVSLAELNGDVSSRGSSQFPSRRPSATRLVDIERSKEAEERDPAVRALSTDGALVPLSFVTLSVRVLALFAFGVLYGQFSRHLHDNHQVTTYTLDIDQTGAFSLLWGSQGIVLGFLLPFFDWMLPDNNRKWSRGKGGSDWTSIIRAAAAFMGVAYGVRKLSWNSSLQAAFYWGMVNPCLWLILDGSRNGFLLSSLTAVIGTSVFAVVFPSHLPILGLNEEFIAVAVWVASVFFCSSICFGNIGRRLLSFDGLSRTSLD